MTIQITQELRRELNADPSSPPTLKVGLDVVEMLVEMGLTGHPDAAYELSEVILKNEGLASAVIAAATGVLARSEIHLRNSAATLASLDESTLHGLVAKLAEEAGVPVDDAMEKVADVLKAT